MNQTKIDRRKSYYVILDTETITPVDEFGNLLPKQSLVYDVGAAVIDKKGNVYQTVSYLVDEVFFGMPHEMNSAYYADKIDDYFHKWEKGEIKRANILAIRAVIRKLVYDYDAKAIIAHNAYFDFSALQNTIRTLTSEKYFFPFGIPIWDTLKMVTDTIYRQKTYRNFCTTNGYICKNGAPKRTAEVLYKYITNDTDYTESHTGLEDIMIEKEIFSLCMRQHKKMRKELFQKK